MDKAALETEIGQFYADPLGYVMFNFPWEDEMIQHVELAEPWASKYNSKYGPDVWACEFLEDIGREVKKRNFSGQKGVKPIRFSTASGHGIGKSTLVAWLVMWIMDTRPNCKITVTASTAPQLQAKTWAEIGKWWNMALTKDAYTYTSSRGNMNLQRIGVVGEWFAKGQTCKEEDSQSFAGQHAASSSSVFIFDEASGIADKIYEVREGGLTEGEPHVYDFGNPTENTGFFYENTVGKYKDRYKTRSIDSRTCFLSNKEMIQELADSFGEESDLFKVRVKGEFGSAGSTQFIPSDYIRIAQERPLEPSKFDQLFIGVDVSRMGGDESVIYPRVGYDARSFAPKRYMKLEADQLVEKIIQEIQYFRSLGKECKGLFVDATGIGGPVCDFLRKYGYDPIPVTFGGWANDQRIYQYRSDEIWGNMREVLRTKLCIPGPKTEPGKVLEEQLRNRQFGYTKNTNKIHLESKEDMRARGVGSPDMADALAVTFAIEIAPVSNGMDPKLNLGRTLSDYDPYNTKELS